MKVSRPVLRYHGGKWRLAPWIISHFPSHRIYVEPFGGAASVLMRKAPSYAEVYNDLDGEVVNIFRLMRDPESAKELVRQLELTPWARQEFEAAYEPTDDPIEQARRRIVRTFMGFGTSGISTARTGFRDIPYRDGSCQTGINDWSNYPKAIRLFTRRLRKVSIECKPAIDLIIRQDSPETLFYCDPPYVLDTRTALALGNKGYNHEMTDDDHRQLAEVLHTVEGMVVLSGYDSPLYRELYSDWNVKHTQAQSQLGGVSRTELLWLSPNVVELPLFKGMAI